MFPWTPPHNIIAINGHGQGQHKSSSLLSCVPYIASEVFHWNPFILQCNKLHLTVSPRERKKRAQPSSSLFLSKKLTLLIVPQCISANSFISDTSRPLSEAIKSNQDGTLPSSHSRLHTRPRNDSEANKYRLNRISRPLINRLHLPLLCGESPASTFYPCW